MLFIKLYQWIISPWLGPRCRFYPNCSDYALQAFSQHNCWKALLLSLRRLGCCQPLSDGGYDPVPPSTNKAHHREYHHD